MAAIFKNVTFDGVTADTESHMGLASGLFGLVFGKAELSNVYVKRASITGGTVAGMAGIVMGSLDAWSCCVEGDLYPGGSWLGIFSAHGGFSAIVLSCCGRASFGKCYTDVNIDTIDSMSPYYMRISAGFVGLVMSAGAYIGEDTGGSMFKDCYVHGTIKIANIYGETPTGTIGSGFCGLIFSVGEGGSQFINCYSSSHIIDETDYDLYPGGGVMMNGFLNGAMIPADVFNAYFGGSMSYVNEPPVPEVRLMAGFGMFNSEDPDLATYVRNCAAWTGSGAIGAIANIGTGYQSLQDLGIGVDEPDKNKLYSRDHVVYYGYSE